jgi:hypothetical protein
MKSSEVVQPEEDTVHMFPYDIRNAVTKNFKKYITTYIKKIDIVTIYNNVLTGKSFNINEIKYLIHAYHIKCQLHCMDRHSNRIKELLTSISDDKIDKLTILNSLVYVMNISFPSINEFYT